MKDFTLGILTMIVIAVMMGEDEDKKLSSNMQKGKEYICYIGKQYKENKGKSPYSNRYEDLPIVVDEKYTSDEDWYFEEVCEEEEKRI